MISLIGQGLGTREIAEQLSLSVKTVETHRLTIKRKLSLETNAQLVQYANAQLKHKMLFGSDYPLITPDRWIKDFNEAAFKPEVRNLILKENAIRALKLA